MIYAWIGLVLGLMALVKSADVLLKGAVTVGRYHGWSELLIGVILIGIGTSLPEIMVSGFSALDGKPGLALGNAYGSNIANIALVMGFSLIFGRIHIPPMIWKRSLLYLLIATLITLIYLTGGLLDRLYGILAIGAFIVMMVRLIQTQIDQPSSDNKPDHPTLHYGLAWGYIIIGFIILIVSAKCLVWAATTIAHGFNISDEIIGLTVIAIGTSLPELATSITASRQGQTQLILGNVVGSNLLNTLVVVGLAASIHPITVAWHVILRDYLFMSTLTGYVWLRALVMRPAYFTRIEGLLLVSAYIGYLIVIGQNL